MPNKNHYLIVIGNYKHMGGAERQAFHFIEYLRQTINVKVSVLGWYGDGPLTKLLTEMGCQIYHFPYREKKTGLKKWSMFLQMTQFIRNEIKPDVILPFVSVHSKPVCLVWKWTGAKYIWWNQQDEGRGLYKSNMERRALLNAVHVTSNSRAGAEFIHEHYGLPIEDIIVYNNGTPIPDTRLLKPIWRNLLGLAKGQHLVSMIANITPYKDHETLLKAWGNIVKKFPSGNNSAPVLALAGHLKEKKHVLELKALAFDLGLSDSVRFLGAIETTNELIYESDLVVHSSLKEGCPNAVCEAMALGRAVVGTDISGMRQAMGEQYSEYVYAKPSDHNDLSEKIERLLSDDSLRKEIELKNHERILTEFSIKGMNEFLFQLIKAEH